METIGLGVVGAGLVGRRHMDAIERAAGVDIIGVVEPSNEGASYVCQQGHQLFPSLEAMLLDADVSGVILATPTPLHVQQARLCIDAGVPVLIEKPISVSAQEAAPIVALAEEKNVPILVGHHRRHNPIIRKAWQIIASGALGEVRAVQATCWFYKPDPYFAEAPWRTKKGAGPISVNLIHDVDLLRHLVGDVKTVQAVAAPSARGFENEDVAAAVLHFQNGAVGTITVSDSIVAPWSWEHTAAEYPVYPVTPENCYQLGGSKASLSVPDLRLWQHEGGGQDWWTPIGATSQIRESADPLINQIAHFAAIIQGQEKPLVSGREGLRSLQVVEAIQRAADSGQAVQFLQE
ncbi:MAG: Gfo/Idh/MocA family oxidoreductase [Pseudomonadota bacterium]